MGPFAASITLPDRSLKAAGTYNEPGRPASAALGDSVAITQQMDGRMAYIVGPLTQTIHIWLTSNPRAKDEAGSKMNDARGGSRA